MFRARAPKLATMPTLALPTLRAILPARLRPLHADDAAAWSRYLSLPGVTGHTSWGDVSERALRRQIAAYLPTATHPRWALVGAWMYAHIEGSASPR